MALAPSDTRNESESFTVLLHKKDPLMAHCSCSYFAVIIIRDAATPAIVFSLIRRDGGCRAGC